MLRTAGSRLFELVPERAYRAALGLDVLGVFYHVVSDQPLPHVESLFPYKTPRMFERDLDYLSGHATLLSYDDVVLGRGDRRRAVVLTFDDGYAEFRSVARPLLLEHGAPCLLFVTTDLIDNRTMFFRNKVSLCIDRARRLPVSELDRIGQRLASLLGSPLEDADGLAPPLLALSRDDGDRIDEVCALLDVDVPRYLRERRPYMTAEELRGLAAEGFTLGSHSKSHPLLGLLDEDEIEAEIVESSAIVRELTGAERVPFAFPFSSVGVSARLLEHVRLAYPWIGPFFDGGSLSRRAGVIGRVSADKPAANPERSTLGRTFHGAYRNALAARITRRSAFAAGTD